MPVLQPLLRLYRDNYHFLRFRVASVVLSMVILGRHAQSLRTVHNCGVCGHSTSRVPKVCGNPLAALGCQLVEGVLYVSKLPVTADGKVSASHNLACTRGLCLPRQQWDTWGRKLQGSCPQEAPKSGFKRESAVADHHKQREATLASSRRSHCKVRHVSCRAYVSGKGPRSYLVSP